MTKREDETGEHSFDELAGGITDGTLSRSRALKAVGAAILGRLRPLRRGRGRMRRITVFLALIVAALASVGAGGAVSAKASLEVDAAAWGRNQQGQLGDRTNSDSNVPLRVRDLKDVTAVAAGGFHSLALKNDGTVAAWGQDISGQLGNGPPNSNSNVPVPVSNLSGVKAIAGGALHSLALKNDGTVAAWGANLAGQLGNGTNDLSNVPVQVSNLKGVTAIAGGGTHSLAIRKKSLVMAWGQNAAGQLGNGTNDPSNVPVQVSNLKGVKAIAGGFSHSLALKKGGTVAAWGSNSSGQLGNGTSGTGTDSNVPVQVSGLSGVTGVAGGVLHSLAT